MPKAIKRRDFLKATVASIAAPTLLSACATKQQSAAHAPSGKVTLGCIGVGNHGTTWNLEAFLKIPEARVLADFKYIICVRIKTVFTRYTLTL